MWAFIVMGAVGAALWIIIRSYERYNANPIVITLEKNFRKWNVTFPASTICFVDKLDEEKAKNVIERYKGFLLYGIMSQNGR